jgi:hypothetical protein
LVPPSQWYTDGTWQFRENGSPAEYGASLAYAIEGAGWKHESATYVKFTQASADLFAWTPAGWAMSQVRQLRYSLGTVRRVDASPPKIAAKKMNWFGQTSPC